MNDATQFFDTAAGGGYEIERSLRFNSSDSAYLSKVYGSNGNRTTWTISFWMKLGRLNTGQRQKIFGAGVDYISTGITYVELDTNNQLQFFTYASGYVWRKLTTQVFRDCSSWYHVCCAFDSSNGTASDRARIYINGSRVVTFASSSDPSSSYNSTVGNSTQTHHISGPTFDTAQYFDGYLADIHFIDGQALDPTSFGEFDDNGVWQPKAYTGTVGTNGFHLPFSNNSTAAALGTDTSGNGNTWTVNNISVAAGAGNDSLVDSPTNGTQTDTGVGGEVVGNYATLNPTVGANGTTNVTLSNGNLDYTNSDGSFRRYIPSTITMPSGSGKYYCEGVYTTSTQTDYDCFGVIDAVLVGNGKSGASNVAGIWAYRRNGNADIEATGGTLGIAYGSSWATNDVIGIAYDSDSGSLTFYKNGVSQGVLVTGITNTVCFFVAGFSNCVAYLNFGQRPFAYTAPSGFKALCTANLPTPTIEKGSDYFDTTLYTGNGSTQTISGLDFEPDLVWIKNRAQADNHKLLDTVRGATNELESNTTDAEVANADGLTAFNSDGFALGADVEYNTSSEAYVAWNWDAGSSTVTNTQGSITSTVRANASAGFSIVTYTGDGAASGTIGHGLGVAPHMIMVKNRDVADEGSVYHIGTDATSPENYFLKLFSTSNGTAAARSDTGAMWNDTAPTSTVFSVGTEDNVNASTEDYVAYCFAPVDGYSSFGSYTGNASADGPFVYTGFRPRYLLMKRSSTSGSNWGIYDSARDEYNVSTELLRANLSNAEATLADSIDFLSNGFKWRTSSTGVNDSGENFIYAAFAEHPFQYSRAR